MKLKIYSFLIITSSLLFLICSNVFSQEYWLRQNTPTTKRLTNCFFVDTNTGWVSGDSGIIMKSTDSGINWNIQNSNTFHDIISMHFVNERLGWANAWIFNPEPGEYPGTLLLKTTNGGDTWESEIFPDTNEFYGTVYYLDSLNGFIGGSPQFILYTANGGQSWTDAISDSNGFNGFPVNHITFLNRDTGYATGGVQDIAGIVWKTVNKGRNWAPVPTGPNAVNDIYIFHPDTAICLTGDFKFGASFYRTNNNWLTSFNVNLGYVGMALSIDFRKRNDGWITIGYLGKIFRSVNSGDNWTKLEIPDSSAIFDIQFIDTTYGWCVGDHGSVYKYNTTMTDITSTNTFQISDYKLHQNYPNPFNPVTKIVFEIPRSVNGRSGLVQTELKIYDILGNEIKTLLSEKKSPGRYEVTFDASGLSSGVYFYRLSADGRQVTGRSMLLLK
ncbi:MAG: T9SS type A sorting domain-containing protein [Ignavibacteria bacterium]|nr:T9SS type A sorting domain-containing protein [Ignavibacteria bacterium]